MSLLINVDNVTAALLADGWHSVTGQSFDLDSYEFATGAGYVLLGGGVCQGVASTGFSFLTDGGKRIKGPLTALLAIEETP